MSELSELMRSEQEALAQAKAERERIEAQRTSEQLSARRDMWRKHFDAELEQKHTADMARQAAEILTKVEVGFDVDFIRFHYEQRRRLLRPTLTEYMPVIEASGWLLRDDESRVPARISDREARNSKGHKIYYGSMIDQGGMLRIIDFDVVDGLEKSQVNPDRTQVTVNTARKPIGFDLDIDKVGDVEEFLSSSYLREPISYTLQSEIASKAPAYIARLLVLNDIEPDFVANS